MRRSHDTRAVRLRDREMLQNDTKIFVSPNVNLQKSITINSCIFEIRKGETKLQAETRIKSTYKNNQL
jgi:hypothetical protein